MSKIKVVKDFLKYYTFTELLAQFNSPNFPWYWTQSIGEPEQYVNLLYFDHQFSSAMNPTMNRCLMTATEQLGVIAILRVKLNATPRNAPEQEWHTDWQISTPSKTCVLYLNDNNGYTEFKTGEKFYSRTNTALIFDTNMEHRGVPATDVDRRLVLNISYFER
tara:strand:+ start:104 stop:592 length:489 start_codon:yes stop_codon:yes gene_type:complete